ncbi:MAG: recombinase A, partial [Myxococcota bacterium]
TRPPPRATRKSTLVPYTTLFRLVGRLTELSSTEGGSTLTVATGLLLSAQCDGEPVAWIAPPERLFYPPDLAASGVDLNALAVVRIEGGATALARAGDKLLRSGAFGLVVIDFGRDASISQALQSRLVGLAQKHESAVVMLTEKSQQSASVGSLVSLRAQTKRVRLGAGRFACELEIIKDKRRGPGWTHRELCRGPMGLR